MFYETGKRDKTKLPHDPFKAIVAPRPIGWISTRALDGRVNLAPTVFSMVFAAFRRLSASPARAGRTRSHSPGRAASSSPIWRRANCAIR